MALSRAGRGWAALVGLAIGVGLSIGLTMVSPKLAAALGAFGLLTAGGANLFYSKGNVRRKPATEERPCFDARETVAHRADNTAPPADKTDVTTTNVRCHNCQHVQTVPVSQKRFVCERCKGHLKRRTAPTKST